MQKICMVMGLGGEMMNSPALTSSFLGDCQCYCTNEQNKIKVESRQRSPVFSFLEDRSDVVTGLRPPEGVTTEDMTRIMVTRRECRQQDMSISTRSTYCTDAQIDRIQESGPREKNKRCMKQACK